jgi:DNA-binding MarR family transcriptional regulator
VCGYFRAHKIQSVIPPKTSDHKIIRGRNLCYLRQRIKVLTKQIKQYHKDSTAIIYNRKDVAEPLNKNQMRELDLLDRNVEKLQNQIKELVKLEQDVENIRVELTPRETMIIKYIAERYPNKVRMKDLTNDLQLKRNRVYEHLRAFMIAGYVSHQKAEKHKLESYFITSSGINYIKKMGLKTQPQ